MLPFRFWGKCGCTWRASKKENSVWISRAKYDELVERQAGAQGSEKLAWQHAGKLGDIIGRQRRVIRALKDRMVYRDKEIQALTGADAPNGDQSAKTSMSVLVRPGGRLLRTYDSIGGLSYPAEVDVPTVVGQSNDPVPEERH